MNATKQTFINKSEIKAQDAEHARKIKFNISKYNDAVFHGKMQFDQLEIARQQAKNIKWKCLESLDDYLIAFEKKFTENGGTVIWAENTAQAQEAVLKICRENKTSLVVKSKSMLTEEIHLNAFLEKNNIESVETDLGEYIQQLDGEAPYHIVTPAMHKSKEDVARVFHEKLQTDRNLSPEELTRVARQKLRKKYTEAQVGISGANFLLADTGSICLTENEGNARLCTAFPPVHICLVGIEKIIPSIDHLPLFWPLLSTFGTGQKVTVYNSIISGPRKNNEKDGPEKSYVILLDNGRTNLLADKNLRSSLYCIRCGACLNACPVYKTIGGHSYATTYSGPIGAVISPHLSGFEQYNHLSHASSLCGHCSEVCPVKIDIHNMIHYNRSLAPKLGLSDKKEKWIWKIWKISMQKRNRWNWLSAKSKTKWIKKIFASTWSKQREPLEFKKSFSETWKQRLKK